MRTMHGLGVKTSPVQRETKYSVSIVFLLPVWLWLDRTYIQQNPARVLRKETEDQQQQNQTNQAVQVNL